MSGKTSAPLGIGINVGVSGVMYALPPDITASCLPASPTIAKPPG